MPSYLSSTQTVGPSRARISAASSAGEASMNLRGWKSASSAPSRRPVLARTGRLEGAELALFHPLRFMLASPAEDAAEILARLGPTVWVEDKYDGIRCQLHRLGREVRLYSRDLHDISNQFPEVVVAALELA